MFTYDLYLQYYDLDSNRFQNVILAGLELANPVFRGEQIYLPDAHVVLAEVLNVQHLIGFDDAKPRSIITGRSPHYLPNDREFTKTVNQFVREYVIRKNLQAPSESSPAP